MKLVFQHWRDKLFKLTHALILPLSTLLIVSLLVALGDILIAANIRHQIVLSLRDIGKNLTDFIPLLFGAAIVFYFVKLNKVYALFAYVLALGIFFATQSALIKVDENSNIIDIFNLHNQEYFRFFISSHWKFITLNTSYFGAFIVAVITIWIVNHCGDFQLNKWFSLINKEKFIPIILIPVMLIIGILMIVIWPYIGQGLSWFLMQTANLDHGFDMFFYGFLNALLKPLGFDYVFSALTLETAVGGVLNLKKIEIIANQLGVLHTYKMIKIFEVFDIFKNSENIIAGQKNILDFINYINFNFLPTNNQGDNITTFNWFKNYLNINIGQFTQSYSVTFGLYSGIVGAFIFLSPKEKRKQTILILLPSLLIAIITGIDQPLIFILLFATPLFYFVLYVPFSALSLMLMKLLNAHILGNINQGLIDFINYSIISFAKGSRFWVALPLALFQGIISFLIVCLLIKHFNWNKILHSEHNAIYVSKNYYKYLVNIGFKKQPSNQRNELSIKQQLQDYVIQNIKSKKWKLGDQLPSEQAISIKFNCSRHTARNALSKYVESGILSVRKGQGYFVNNNCDNLFIDGNNQKANFHNQSLKIIPKHSIDFQTAWFNDYNLDLSNFNLNHTYNIEKKYFDKNGELIIYEIAILNRREIFLVNNGLVIDEQMLKYLNLQYQNLTQSYSQVIFIKSQKYKIIAQDLGWKHEFPIIVSILNKNNDWIEISIKIISKNQWEFSRYYKIIN